MGLRNPEGCHPNIAPGTQQGVTAGTLALSCPGSDTAIIATTPTTDGSDTHGGHTH